MSTAAISRRLSLESGGLCIVAVQVTVAVTQQNSKAGDLCESDVVVYKAVAS